MLKQLEKHEGLNGSGQKLFLIVSVCMATGRWIHIERFTNEAEADSWLQWA